MKSFKTIKLLLAASVLSAFSGGVNAAYVSAQGQPSTVVLAAYDTVQSVGYVRDLGVMYDTFYANLKTGNALAGMNLAGDAAFTSIFSASNINDIKWNVSAALDLNAPDDRYLTTATNDTSPFAVNAGLGGAQEQLNIYWSKLNTGSCAGAVVCSGGGSLIGNSAVFWGDSGVGQFGFTTSASLNDAAVTSTKKTLDVFVMAKTLSPVANFFGNFEYEPGLITTLESSFDVNLQLAADGTLSAVPLPPAVWMFGAGLMGFIGIGRRRKTKV